MSINLGIDLGTSNTVVSYWKNRKINTVSIDGKTTFPSVISIKDDLVLCGMQSKARILIDPSRSISSSKRDIGTNKTYNIDGKLITPREVACEILKVIKDKTEKLLNESIDGVVVTVPAYFTSEQREDTLYAAEKAGLKVLRLIPEPTAAAIAYGLGNNKNEKIMVYDLGGGTFDVSILSVNNNDFDVISVDGDSKLGGDDFDNIICNLIYKKINLDLSIDILLKTDKQHIIAKQRIKEAAEKAKIELSYGNLTEIIIPNLLNNYCLEFELTRDEYNNAIMPIVNKTILKVRDVLNKANLKQDDIDKVILVGGATKMPIIKDVLKNEIKDPYIAGNVDEIVSNGAAILAANLSKIDLRKTSNDLPQIFIKEKTVISYGIGMLDKDKNLYFNIIIPRGSLLPCKSGIIGFTNHPYQEEVNMTIYRGESVYIDHNEKIGELVLPIFKKSPSDVPVGAIFEVDDNMIIKFTAIEFNNDELDYNIIYDAINNNGILDVERVQNLVCNNKVRYSEVKIDIN